MATFDAFDIVGKKFKSSHGEEYIVKRYLSRINGVHKYVIEFTKTKTEKEYPRQSIKDGKVADIWTKEKTKQNKEKKLNQRKTSLNKDYSAICSNGKIDFLKPTLVLDQATKITGYSIYINGKLDKYGIIKSHYDNVNDRINEISKNVEELIKKYSIKNITFEDIYLDNNLTVFKHLALLLGVLINVAIKNNCNYTTINILEWKEHYGIHKLGNRDLGKEFGKKVVLENLGISVIDDVSDSILMGYYILNKEFNSCKESYEWE